MNRYKTFDMQIDRESYLSIFFGNILVGFTVILLASVIFSFFDWTIFYDYFVNAMSEKSLALMANIKGIKEVGYPNPENLIGFSLIAPLFFRFIAFPLAVFYGIRSSLIVKIENRYEHFRVKKLFQ